MTLTNLTMANYRSQEKKLAALEKRKQALQLAIAGVDYQTIADRVGYNSRQAAHAAVKSALVETLRPPSDELRQMQLTRLDEMIKYLWSQVSKGNYNAVDRIIKIEERRAKLLGLDAPTKTDLTTNGKDITTIKVIWDDGSDNTPPETP